MKGLDFRMYGEGLLGDAMKPKSSGIVSDRFLIPPFSVLNTRMGDWKSRKKAWMGLGIKGEIGREAAAIHCPNSSSSGPLVDANYTSVFDPVLCELAYRWWCRGGGQVVDPFAGGSVRGVVASLLGFKYWGCDLRQEQISANIDQAYEIGVEKDPVWVCGDSAETIESAPEADFVFSCPPYGDLEKYSDDPRDLSFMKPDVFLKSYRAIISGSCKRLKNNRFACFVVGDFRDNKGHYRDFVSETIKGFTDCGLDLYNEAILVTSVGSASMRVTKQFNAGRKLCKTHQNVLVFVKGDWRKAVEDINKNPVNV